MSRDNVLNKNYLIRRDIGNLLFHWTKRNGKLSAFEILKKILCEEELLGGNKEIKGMHKCVCFNEIPISETASLFKLYKSGNDSERIRFEPYGIGVQKDWFFSQGGRPAIYQPNSDYNLLHDSLKWKHVRYEYEPDLIDFTWEREWRIKTDSLKLDPKHIVIIVPTAEEAFELMKDNSKKEYDDLDQEGVPQSEYLVPIWMVVSLDLFGIKV